MKKRGLAALPAVAGLLVAALSSGTAVADTIPALAVNSGWGFDQILFANQDSLNGPFVFSLDTSLYVDGKVWFRITDAFQVGDHFSVFDFGALILETSDVNGTAFGDQADADLGWTSNLWESGEMLLGNGNHSLTVQGDGVAGLPAGFFIRLDGELIPRTDPPTTPHAPLPSASLMGLALLGGLGGYAEFRRRQRRIMPA